MEEPVEVSGARFAVLVEREAETGGWIASCRELPGCVTWAPTVEEVRRDIREAIGDCLAVRGGIIPRSTQPPGSDG